MSIAAAAPHLRVADVALYLRKAGWQRTPHPNGRLLVFRQNQPLGEEMLKIVIASSDDFEDAPNLIANAVAVLAELQGVQPSVHALYQTRHSAQQLIT